MSKTNNEIVKTAKPYIKKWNEFVESTFKILLAYGTKDEKNINISRRKDIKKLMQESAAEMKALFYKFSAAEAIIVENELEESYKALYSAMVKDDLG